MQSRRRRRNGPRLPALHIGLPFCLNHRCLARGLTNHPYCPLMARPRFLPHSLPPGYIATWAAFLQLATALGRPAGISYPWVPAGRCGESEKQLG
jgi:hypothetical protein